MGPSRRLRGDDPEFPFEPGVHVNYESTVLPMKDGLPKLEDSPEELGGSGETLADSPVTLHDPGSPRGWIGPLDRLLPPHLSGGLGGCLRLER